MARPNHRDYIAMRDDQETPPASAAEPAVPDLAAVLRLYGRPILIGAVVAAVIVVGIGMVRRSRRAAADQAARMLVSGRPEQLEALLRQYKATPGAPVARLALARLDFHSGRYEEAEKRYAEFLALHRNHPWAVVAEVNRATCLEAKGRLEEAVKAYEAVLSRDKTSLFASAAMLGRARALEQAGRYTDARHAYEEYIAANPEGPLAGVAEANLKTLEQKRRAAQKVLEVQLAPPTAATNAPAAVPAPAPIAPAAP